MTNTFPERSLPLDATIDIMTEKPLGPAAQVIIQETARKLPLYNEPIECHAEGRDDQGHPIQVNTLGRWLFGVPGYKGHVRVVPDVEKVTMYYPSAAMQIVHELIRAIKEVMEHKS